MGDHVILAMQAATEASRATSDLDATKHGLAAVALALLEVADAIREASTATQ